MLTMISTAVIGKSVFFEVLPDIGAATCLATSVRSDGVGVYGGGGAL